MSINGKTVSGYTMGYLGLKKSSGYTNMIAMLTVTVCIKLRWAQELLSENTFIITFEMPGFVGARSFTIRWVLS